MTYNALLKRLQKMTPEQLKQRVMSLEGCSGNWDSLTSVEIVDEDTYRDGEGPGVFERDIPGLPRLPQPKPVVKKGDPFLLHDH